MFGPFVSGSVIRLIEILKIFYPPKDSAKADSVFGPFDRLSFYCVLGGRFVCGMVIRLFEIFKMFLPPEGLFGAEPERGPIVFTLHFIGVGRGTGGFKF